MSNVTSQSELTTKEIVEQAIQDYHESILPYLNGQVPIIANKFDKANLYSTDEQIVGRWKDGRPLYQKTVNLGTLPVGSSSQYVTKEIDHNVSNIDIIMISGDGTYATSGMTYFPLPYPNAVSVNYQIDIVATKTKIIVTVSDDRSDLTGIATILYTKTTDEAIAIGSDTDYSLEEKIVGTDIDGKFIYQKTINIGTQSVANSEIFYDISSLGVEKCWVINAYATYNSNIKSIPTRWAYVWYEGYNKIRFNSYDCAYTFQNITVTVQYTKTTD